MDKEETSTNSFKTNLGRFLLAMVFILHGAAILIDSAKFENQLVEGYAKTYARFYEYTRIALFFTPARVALNSKIIALSAAVFELFSSFLLICNFRIGAKWLIAFQILLVIFVENHLNFSKNAAEWSMISILNLGIAAGLLFLCGSQSSEKEKAE
ncbi:unnamed protein product [Blepharisma stoltei]|uniref:DoxX family protein n=1 Tax=Blepharisma stoltei TaxID=1481888 RepID=A0AAU9JSM2_9CILI|nr:unnamed protein product [Blepharisma stoltei]